MVWAAFHLQNPNKSKTILGGLAQMLIKFIDDAGNHVGAKPSRATSDWDACLEGHAYLACGAVNGAVDFDVVRRTKNS